MKRYFAVTAIFFASLMLTFAEELEMFGPNVHFYKQTDDYKSIAAELDAIHMKMRTAQFSKDRHAVFFFPGDYTKVGLIDVPYYMSVAGLGKLPYQVVLSNISTPSPFIGSENALCTFWRSLENVYIKKNNNKIMHWGVSQAAPIRRVVSERKVWYDMGGYASGGFAADCKFLESAGTKTQQQWYTRNSYIEKGTEGMVSSGWNYGFQGVVFGKSAKSENASYEDTWSRGNGWGNLTFVYETPIVREKPFLFYDEELNAFKVFVPDWRKNERGVSYTESNPGKGIILDVEKDFYIAKPGVSADELNKVAAKGKNILFTPGIYEMDSPIYINRDNAIVMGMGLATIAPGINNKEAALIVGDDCDNVIICSLMFDAFYDSRTLISVGTKDYVHKSNSEAPVMLSDIFCRVGGFVDRNVNADIMVEINRDNTVADHFWLWRADHGHGVGWFKNTCRNGLVVNGDDVTIYGLFNEHAQEYQTLWNGENGNCFFYQSETPYDMQSQSDYMSHDGKVNGYASYKVSDNVKHHFATMMGVYDVFVKTGGAKIVAESSIEVPKTEDVRIHNACNFGLSQHNGGFVYIVNDSVSSTLGRRITRHYIVDYPAK